MREIEKNMLEQIGYTNIAEAENSEQVMELLESVNFIIIDALVPDQETVLDLIKEIKIKDKTLPILAVVNLSATEDAEALREGGADNIITKPFNPTTLKKGIAAAIYRRPPGTPPLKIEESAGAPRPMENGAVGLEAPSPLRQTSFFPSIESEDAYNQIIEKMGDKELAYILFWAPWCAPCRMIMASRQKVVIENPDISSRVSFFMVDVDEVPEIATREAICNIPTGILYKDGKRISTMIGVKPSSEIEEWIMNSLE